MRSLPISRLTNKRHAGKGRRLFPALIAAAASAWLLPAGAVHAEELGDPERGKVVFRECASCHQIGQGAENRVGPHLNDIFGRPAGALEGFHYSDALKRQAGDGLVWTLEKLDAYISNPRILVSGTRMNYRGLKDPEKRADLLAYLRDFSASPQDIPEAEPTALPSGPDLAPEILAMQGDREYGAYLSAECKTCHQSDGSYQGIPSITYWPEEDFVVALHAYKQKIRPNPVMQMIAGRLSDEEIAALAAYFKDPG